MNELHKDNPFHLSDCYRTSINQDIVSLLDENIQALLHNNKLFDNPMRNRVIVMSGQGGNGKTDTFRKFVPFAALHYTNLIPVYINSSTYSDGIANALDAALNINGKPAQYDDITIARIMNRLEDSDYSMLIIIDDIASVAKHANLIDLCRLINRNSKYFIVLCGNEKEAAKNLSEKDDWCCPLFEPKSIQSVFLESSALTVDVFRRMDYSLHKHSNFAKTFTCSDTDAVNMISFIAGNNFSLQKHTFNVLKSGNQTCLENFLRNLKNGNSMEEKEQFIHKSVASLFCKILNNDRHIRVINWNSQMEGLPYSELETSIGVSHLNDAIDNNLVTLNNGKIFPFSPAVFLMDHHDLFSKELEKQNKEFVQINERTLAKQIMQVLFE